jgi:Ca2+-transporting ATPase
MTTTHAWADGGSFVICKGSPEALLRNDPEAKAAADRFALRGLRVLAVSRGESDRPHLLGLVAHADPIRRDAPGMIDAFGRAGVRPVMITGDHPVTARAIAESLAILGPGDRTAMGDQWDDGEPSAVYARVRPEQKTAIVSAMQHRGEIVAMTGDGVNDAPALRVADIGIAMGRRGTEVAKRAVDLVLTEDDLSAMVPAIAEGRRVYDNLRRFLHYALSGGVAEVLIMLFGPLFGFAVPLQAGQILWVNLLTHGLPGVAMGSEPPSRGMRIGPGRAPSSWRSPSPNSRWPWHCARATRQANAIRCFWSRSG